MNTHCFDVTMHFWIDEASTCHTLLAPQVVTYQVQPPTWCRDDPIVLEMQLDHLAKLKFLYDIRRQITAHVPEVKHLKDRNDFIVRGMMTSYVWPANSHGERKRTEFSVTNARAA